MGIDIELDPNKTVQNDRKHDVTFEDAVTDFQDNLSITAHDSDHSIAEETLYPEKTITISGSSAR